MKIEKIFFKNSKGQKLAGELWTPAKFKYTIILVNGIGNTKELWEKEADSWPAKLAEKGYRVLIFDSRGRGESEGEFIETTLTTNIDDLKSVINFLNSPVILVGQSFGGTTAICVAAIDKKIKCLVTRAAAYNLDEWTNGKRLAEAKKKGYTIGSEPWKKYTLELFEDMRRHKVLDVAKKVKVPWLILHGDKDTNVPLHHAKDFYAAAKCEKKLAIIKGADHSFSSKEADSEVFALIVDWLKRMMK